MPMPFVFGTMQSFQQLPMPSSGIQRANVFSAESATLDRGGAAVTRSTGRHVEFDFSFGQREAAANKGGLDIYLEYATGVWDDYSTVVNGFNPNNLIYFADPMSARSNLFSPHWAAPMLSLSGDYPWIGNYLSNAATGGTLYRQPSRSVAFNVTDPAFALPTQTARRFVIPIPTGHTLRWGWSGTATGTGVIRAEARNRSTGAIVGSNVAPLPAASNTRIGNAINGDTYDCVTFGISRTDSSASAVVITSMMAQIHPNTLTPSLIGNHVSGQGQTGCRFAADLVEEYIQADDQGDRRIKGLSFGLVEVGAWL